MTNFYAGLARGPIDHESSSVINSISATPITMGSCVLVSPPGGEELLARVFENPSISLITQLYGIATGGDVDGVYGDGNEAFTDVNRATNAAEQGVEVCTQGRCLARVESTVEIAIGDPLSSSDAGVGNEGAMINQLTNPTSPVLARALQPLPASPGFHIIAVDVQREGGAAFEATTGFIEVSVPKMTIQSSSTDSGDLYGGFPQGAQNPYSFPFPGTITKIIINTLSGGPTLGGGWFELIKKPLSGTGTTPLGQLPLTSAFGLDIHTVSYAFVANDGFQFHIQANNVGALFNFFIEVEYDLI